MVHPERIQHRGHRHDQDFPFLDIYEYKNNHYLMSINCPVHWTTVMPRIRLRISNEVDNLRRKGHNGFILQ